MLYPLASSLNLTENGKFPPIMSYQGGRRVSFDYQDQRDQDQDLRNSVIYIAIVSLPTKRRRAEAFARCNVREHGVRVAAFEYRVPALNARNSRDYRYRDNVCRTCHWGRQTGWNRNRAAELVKSSDMLIRWPESNILKGGGRDLRVPRMRAQSDLILIYVFGRNTSAISAPPSSPPRGISWSFGIIERRIDAARDHPTDKFTVSSGGIMRRRASPTIAETRWGPSPVPRA